MRYSEPCGHGGFTPPGVLAAIWMKTAKIGGHNGNEEKNICPEGRIKQRAENIMALGRADAHMESNEYPAITACI